MAKKDLPAARQKFTEKAVFSELTPRVMLFPLALVLFEFAVYVANDMVLPAMPGIIKEFNGRPADIPTAMSAYILGGILLRWLLGPLSDQVGRRPVMFFGVITFIFACLGVYFIGSLDQFFALRVIQGLGIGYVFTVGYATVHDKFTDKAAVKVTSLMANMSQISPMIGPLAGALILLFAPWQMIFAVIAFIAAVSCLGLYFTMPETGKIRHPGPGKSRFSFGRMLRDYRRIFTTKRFLYGAVTRSFLNIPLIMWLGISPAILMQGAGLGETAFALWQIPIFLGIILGNIWVFRLINRYSPDKIIYGGIFLLLAGILFAFVSVVIFHKDYVWLIAGFSVYAVGSSLQSGILYRLLLMAVDMPKGTVSAAFGMVISVVMIFFLELVGYGFEKDGTAFFVTLALISIGIFLATLFLFARTGGLKFPEQTAYEPLRDAEESAEIL